MALVVGFAAKGFALLYSNGNLQPGIGNKSFQG